MGLKCGIIGLSKSGKTTIFNCVSNTKAQASGYDSASKSNLGQVSVPDPRLQILCDLAKSQKIIPVSVDIVDIPGLTKGGQEGGGNKFLAEIQQTDALIHVLRCFDDLSLAHPEGNVDPVRDKEIVELELQVRDLGLIERKIAKLEKLVKIGDKDAKVGIEVLTRFKNHVEDFQAIRTMEASEEDRKWIADMFLLSDKPVIYVCNVDDASAINGNHYVEKVLEAVKGENTEVLIVAGQLEAEIAALEDPEDRKVFLEDAGLHEPGVDRLVRSAYKLLKLMSFFTVGPKEIHAWTIHQGMTAPQAAGVIHSDLERGFIRAEVIKYKDFVQYKTEHACREVGKLAVEGKSYVVCDGDLLNIRFNV